MIDLALQFTNSVLEEFLGNKLGLDENKVILNNIIEANGSIPSKNQNKIVISLINVERETLRPFHQRQKIMENGNYSHEAPIERYNLDILTTSNFDDYNEALKFLTEVILFFQINPAVDSKSHPNMPKRLHRLEFEMETISYHQMHNLWNAMGAKYQPSVIYKMRLITLNANETERFNKAVSQTFYTTLQS